MTGDWGYLVIWEFRVKKGMESSFEQAYGPEGVWAQLFERGDGFVGTELTSDIALKRRYLTLDFWKSKEAYEKFRQTNADRYGEIDAECEAMTESEVEIGRFARVGEPRANLV